MLRSIAFERQKEIRLAYKGKEIGIHRLDFIVEDKVILEIKATDDLHKIFEAQLLTYLRATGKKVGLLINFNVSKLKEGIKRMIY
jgi:GxxExxY protein